MSMLKIAVIGAVVIAAFFLCVLTARTQKSNITEWLLWAVTEAEKLLGGGTGALKLREVYDRFVQQYPLISRVVPFEVFGGWVDLALAQMRHLLKTNADAAAYVDGGGTNE